MSGCRLQKRVWPVKSIRGGRKEGEIYESKTFISTQKMGWIKNTMFMHIVG